MNSRTWLGAVCLSLLVFTGGAYAQDSGTTVLLRSGERVTGSLVDMGGVDFTMTVNGQERRIPIADVVLIDFTGKANNLPKAEVDKFAADRHLVVMRDGTTTHLGTLYDIGGTNPLRITVRRDGGELTLNSNEIGRIYLANPATTTPTAVATTGTTTSTPDTTTPAPAGAIAVPANQQWTPTGIFVRRGETVTFSTQGDIRLSSDQTDAATVTGSKAGRKAPGSPMPNELAGALLFRVGNSPAYGLGNQSRIVMPASGQLFLGINDDHVADNTGTFYVNVNRTGR